LIAQDRAVAVGREAILGLLSDPGEEAWFEGVAGEASPRWHALLAMGLGMQHLKFGKRLTRRYLRDFIRYFAKSHMITRAQDPTAMEQMHANGTSSAHWIGGGAPTLTEAAERIS
jgi:hypothetical protein